MCEWCGRKECTLTKQQVIERGPIIEKNASGYMRGPTDASPMTYSFSGVPAYYSLSALMPDENEENPHAYMRFVFDEDEGTEDGWECTEIDNPLSWPTEKEIMKKIDEANRKERERRRGLNEKSEKDHQQDN